MTSGANSVLVVGGTSFIARHLLARRSAAGLTTFATCRRAADAPPLAGVTWLDTDLAAADVTRTWPATIDTVVSLAQSRAWRQFPEGAADVFAVNVRGAFETAEYARRAGARRLIYASSGSVYGSTPPIDVSTPRSFYVASKLAAEALLSGYQSTLPIITLRLFMPYGDFQDAAMLLPQIVKRIREGETITLDRDGGLQANPVAASDVAETIERCMILERSVTADVAGPEILSLQAMAGLIGAILQREIKFAHRDAAPPRVVGSDAALSAALGWTPPTRPADGFARWLSATRQ